MTADALVALLGEHFPHGYVCGSTCDHHMNSPEGWAEHAADVLRAAGWVQVVDLLDRLGRAEAAVARVGALAEAWASQPTDYEEDTEQQIWDGNRVREALEGPSRPLTADLRASGPESVLGDHRDDERGAP